MGRAKPIGERPVNGGTFVRFSDDEFAAIDAVRSRVKELTGFTVTVSDVIKTLVVEAIAARTAKESKS